MTQQVGDYRSNPNDQIAHAVNVLKRSKRMQLVFFAVYSGKRVKTVREIHEITGLSEIAVAQVGGRLHGQQLLLAERSGRIVKYSKDSVYNAVREKIRAHLKNPAGFKRLPTKYNQQAGKTTVTIQIDGKRAHATQIGCEEIEEFRKVKGVRNAPKIRIAEKKFKYGVAKILDDTGKFTDWGGETNDLLSRANVAGKSRSIAFAFKGPATTGVLTPKKMGKNGNQIQRLFTSPAVVFVVQYHSQIGDSVLEQMATHAKMRSYYEGTRVWYCVINGDDTNRLMVAYPKAFGLKAK
jgi:hypothetical protein